MKCNVFASNPPPPCTFSPRFVSPATRTNIPPLQKRDREREKDRETRVPHSLCKSNQVWEKFDWVNKLPTPCLLPQTLSFNVLQLSPNKKTTKVKYVLEPLLTVPAMCPLKSVRGNSSYRSLLNPPPTLPLPLPSSPPLPSKDAGAAAPLSPSPLVPYHYPPSPQLQLEPMI